MITIAVKMTGIRNQKIFISDTTKAFGQVNSTCLQKTYSIFKVSKQYITIIRSKKKKKKKNILNWIMYQQKEYATKLRQFSNNQWKSTNITAFQCTGTYY